MPHSSLCELTTMPDLSIRDLTDSGAPSTSRVVPGEPSHIHIPRPSRVRASMLIDPEETSPLPVQLDLLDLLDLALDQAA